MKKVENIGQILFLLDAEANNTDEPGAGSTRTVYPSLSRAFYWGWFITEIGICVGDVV
jgi:hypothetical protein